MTGSRFHSEQCRRGGFSLLEVLVACGILVVALGSIAALLPAAGSRLAEAAAQDRATATAATAMAEIQTRNLVSRGLIPTGTWVISGSTYSPSAVLFGETLSLALTTSATSAGFVTPAGTLTATTGSVALTTSVTVGPIQALFMGTVPVLSAPVPTVLDSLINNDTSSATRRGFFLEDELQYGLSATSDLPANSFDTGIRRFNRGACWGAMITPINAPWAAATAAKVSVAVFRKPGNATALTLVEGPSGGSGMFVSGSTTPISLQRSILKPCSMVLAINGAAAPQWLPIRSSWILTGTMIGTSGTFVGVPGTSIGAIASSGTGRTCVTFATPVPSTLINSGTLNVIGFENLLLVDEKLFPLP